MCVCVCVCVCVWGGGGWSVSATVCVLVCLSLQLCVCTSGCLGLRLFVSSEYLCLGLWGAYAHIYVCVCVWWMCLWWGRVNKEYYLPHWCSFLLLFCAIITIHMLYLVKYHGGGLLIPPIFEVMSQKWYHFVQHTKHHHVSLFTLLAWFMMKLTHSGIYLFLRWTADQPKNKWHCQINSFQNWL